MTTDRHQSRVFLLSILGAAGCGAPTVEPNGDSGTTRTSGSASTGAASTGTTGTAEDAGADASTGSGGSQDEATSIDTGHDDTTAGESTDTGGPRCGPPPSDAEPRPACVDYAALLDTCNYDGTLSRPCLAEIAGYCEYYLEQYASTYGPGCAAAYEEYYACLSQLGCRAGRGSCSEEQAAIGSACQ